MSRASLLDSVLSVFVIDVVLNAHLHLEFPCNSFSLLLCCICRMTVLFAGHVLFTWLLRHAFFFFFFSGQNRWMFEANRSKCSPYIYQQCYCILYGCLNPYSCFTSIFTPSKFMCYFVNSSVCSSCGRLMMIPVSDSSKSTFSASGGRWISI